MPALNPVAHQINAGFQLGRTALVVFIAKPRVAAKLP